MLYKRGDIWWIRLKFAGVVVRESSKSRSKSIARRAEQKRRRELEEGYNGLSKRKVPLNFDVASQQWLAAKSVGWSAKTLRSEQTSVAHLKATFGRWFLADISPESIANYQRERLKEGASAKTINLEVGTIRAVLRRHRFWANVQPDVKMLPTRMDQGKALSLDEERRLLAECANSRSLTLLPAVVIALNTGMRYREILNIRWEDVDFQRRSVVVTRSKTAAGTGRVIPLNDHAHAVISFVAHRFPKKEPQHFVFASERYGVSGDVASPHAYDVDPTAAVKSLKESWEHAKRVAQVRCRFHDLRHTAATRMLEGGSPLMVIASLLGWSASTAARMAKRYGISATQRRWMPFDTW